MFETLNEQQKRAVEICDKNLLIIAGAGSGKTKTLTYKISYILKNGLAKPYEILALTFTNKAAQEMKERAEHLLDISINSLYIGTFHSIALRFLHNIGKKYTIYDRHDQESLIKEVLLSLNLDKNKFQPSKIASLISRIKNSNFEEVFANKDIEKIFLTYEERLKQQNALDFDNILLNLIDELEKNEQLHQKYMEQFKYILIDEYQDTNNMQYKFIKLFYSKRNRVFAVGDEDQSIYAFRGANINNILSFSEDFLPCEIIKLEKNYRSTRNILHLANTIISNNKKRIGKNLYSDISGIEPIIKGFQTNREEAVYVLEKIKDIISLDNSVSIAILYRNNMISRLFEEYLVKYGINYKKVGAYKFFEKKEIKDVLSFIKLAYNDKDNVSFLRSISLFGGIGEKTIQSIKETAEDQNITLFEAASNLKQKKYAKVLQFIEFIKILQNKISFDSISKCLRFVFNEIFSNKDFYQENLRQGNVEELIEFARDSNIESFMQSVSLYDYPLELETNDAIKNINVNLMTIHGSKGLEFDSVFMVGLNEGILPSLKFDSLIEEERRIMYVGITRAKRNLYLSYYLYDLHSTYLPSRFLKEIDIIVKNPLKSYQAGQIIKHNTLGAGIILSFKEDPIELKVNFFKHGIRILRKDEL